MCLHRPRSAAAQVSISAGHNDVRVRPMIWVWQAAASIAGPALYAVSASSNTNAPFNNGSPVGVVGTGGVTVAYQSFWFIAVFFWLVNITGWLRGFFSHTQDLSVWVISFANAALAVSTVHFYAFGTVPGDYVFRVFVYISVAFACYSVAVCFGATLLWAADGSLFRPRQKWGPLSFNKLMHESW